MSDASSGEPLSMGIEFNVQTFLSEMRKELRADHQRLVERVDLGFSELTLTARAVRDELVNHTADDYRAAEALNQRLSPIENAMKKSNDRVKWTLRTIIGALVVGAIDLMFHWKAH